MAYTPRLTRLVRLWAAAVAALGAAVVVSSIESNDTGLRAQAGQPATRHAENSIDQLNIGIETSKGRRTTLAATAGLPRLVTMFYAHCLGVCPRAIETLQRIEQALSPAERQRLGVVLLTLDPEMDSPEQLRSLEREQKISERWLVGRTSRSDVATLAGRLGIHYRALGAGVVDHASVLVLFDADGKEVARTDQTRSPDAAFLQIVRRTASQDPTR